MKTLIQLSEDAEPVCDMIVDLTNSPVERIALLAIVNSTLNTIIVEEGINHLAGMKVKK